MTPTIDSTTPRQSPAIAPSWRDVLPIHPAAELFPLMSPDELRVLGEDIKKNGITSPIAIVTRKDDKGWRYQLLDGRNRLDAMEAVGMRFQIVFLTYAGCSIDADEFEVTKQATVVCTDPYAYVISANIHRRHLTAEQKRELICTLLKVNPSKSDRQIAETVKASPTFVGKVRAEKEATGDVSTVDTRTDTKGRQQPAKKRRPISPERQAFADQMHRHFQLAKVESYERGNVSAEEKRDERTKIITAGHHARTKEEHPDAGGSHEKMVAVNQAREDLEAGNKIINVGEWWDQEAGAIAAQMAKHFTIKKISELCAMAIDMRKAKQAAEAAPPPADDGLDIPASLRRTAP